MRSEEDPQRSPRDGPLTAYAAGELARRAGKLKKVKSLESLTPAERHRLRIRVKKLRYTVEFFANLFPGKRRERQRKASLSVLTALQDLLGALNDAAAREALALKLVRQKGRSMQGTAPSEAFAAGILYGSQEGKAGQLVQAAESAFVKFRKTKPFWQE